MLPGRAPGSTTDAQKRQLEHLAAASGRKRCAIIREAIDHDLAKEAPKGWREAVRGGARHVDRDNLDDFVRDLRAEWERRLERIYRR